MSRILYFIIILIWLIFPINIAQAQDTPTAERIAFSAYRNGQWDIYSITPEGTAPKQLTRSLAEDTDPAYSPDGTKLAYASRRDRNWDVYVLDLQSGAETRLTTSSHYDGAPTWSPDGQFIAYESYQNGDLDVWVVDASGAEPANNITAESLDGDYAPAWSPDGQFIAFTSWRRIGDVRETIPTNKSIFLYNVNDGSVSPLTNAPTAELQAAWSPDGSRMAIAIDNLGDLEVFAFDVNNPPISEGPLEAITWSGRTDGPAWSPDGQQIAAVFHRWDGDFITLSTIGAKHQLPQLITDLTAIQGRLTWHAQAIDFGATIANLKDPQLADHLYVETFGAKNETYSTSDEMVRLNDIDVGTPWLADTVDDSFQGWRFRLRDEVGYDFLNRLSDATRNVAAYTETSQYASWHKSGRAIDTLFDYRINDQLAHEIVREDYSGETYWRVLLRCVDQSGACGRPITANAWNYSERARAILAPEQGGIEKTNQQGYYVDLTALGREYGWSRISSYDDDEYSWTWHFIAFEYWHYQKRFEQEGVTNWYQAMLDIYPPETLERFFNWDRMQEIGDDPHLIALKGVPLPLSVKPWWNLVE